MALYFARIKTRTNFFVQFVIQWGSIVASLAAFWHHRVTLKPGSTGYHWEYYPVPNTEIDNNPGDSKNASY